ncbi:MAG: hypothetical protein ACAI35_27670 [Candidatus Methylacidiphilales bacterium]
MKYISLLSAAIALAGGAACWLMPPATAWSQSEPQQDVSSSSPSSLPSSRYAPLTLPLGVRLDIPKAWRILSYEAPSKPVEGSEALLKLADTKLPEKPARLFTATAPDSLDAMIYVKVFPSPGGEAKVRACSDDKLKELADRIREGLEKLAKDSGQNILEFYPSKKQVIGKSIALIFSYKRKGIKGDPVMTKMVRLFVGDHAFTVMLSYPEGDAELAAIIGEVERSIGVE